MTNTETTTTTRPLAGTLVVAAGRNNAVIVGIANGDADECGTPDEVIYLTHVIYFDQFSDAERFDGFGVLLSSVWDGDPADVAGYVEAWSYRLDCEAEVADRKAETFKREASEIRSALAGAGVTV